MATYQNQNCNGSCPIPTQPLTGGGISQGMTGSISMPPAQGLGSLEQRLGIGAGSNVISKNEIMKFITTSPDGSITFKAFVDPNAEGFHFRYARSNGAVSEGEFQQIRGFTNVSRVDPEGGFTVRNGREGNRHVIEAKLNPGTEAIRIDYGNQTFYINRSEIMGAAPNQPQRSIPQTTPPQSGTNSGWTSVPPVVSTPIERVPAQPLARDAARTPAEREKLTRTLGATQQLGELLGADREPSMADRLLTSVQLIESKVRPDASGHLPTLPANAAVRALTQISLLRGQVSGALANDPEQLKAALASLDRSTKYLKQQPTQAPQVEPTRPEQSAPATGLGVPRTNLGSLLAPFGPGMIDPLRVPPLRPGEPPRGAVTLGPIGGTDPLTVVPPALGVMPQSIAPPALGPIPEAVGIAPPITPPALGPVGTSAAPLGVQPTNPPALGVAPAPSTPTITPTVLPENPVSSPAALGPVPEPTTVSPPALGPAATSSQRVAPTERDPAVVAAEKGKRDAAVSALITDYYSTLSDYSGAMNFQYLAGVGAQSDHVILNPTALKELGERGETIATHAKSVKEPLRVDNQKGTFFCFFGNDGSVVVIDRAGLSENVAGIYDELFKFQATGKSAADYSETKTFDYRNGSPHQTTYMFTSVESDGTILRGFANALDENRRPKDVRLSAFDPRVAMNETSANNESFASNFGAYDLNDVAFRSIDANGQRLPVFPQ